MFGTSYKNSSSMFYTGLLVGGFAGMLATVWYLGKDNTGKETNLKDRSMLSKDVNQKINNLDDKGKEKIFNNFINPNENENDLLDEFSKTNLTN